MNPFSWQHRNRDLALISTLFLLGLGLMLLMGTLAIGLSPQWTVKANMDSKLDPNAQYVAGKSTLVIEPVLPAILTPPTWQAIYLTPPSATSTSQPGSQPTATLKDPKKTATAKNTSTPASTLRVTGTSQVTGTRTSQVTPSKTYIIFFPSATLIPTKVKSATPNPTFTYTPTKAHTPTITRTFTSTRTSTKTATVTNTATATKTATATIAFTSTRTSTPTITATWTKTLTPTVTFTPTITLTPTFTYTPTVTATWTNSMTPTATLTPTETFTPTITVTPSTTFTPTITLTPTIDPVNWGPGDGIILNPTDGSSVTFTLSPAITNHGDASYDFIYYERATGPSSIQLDQVKLEISTDGSTWYPVLNWGDNIADTNTNVDFIARGLPGEGDNQNISGGLVNGFGIGIDIYSLGLTGSYPYLRVTCANNGNGDGCDIDGFEIYP